MVQDVAVEALSLFAFLGVDDLEGQFPSHPAAVPAAQRLGKVGFFDVAADYPDQVPEQGGVGGMMDVGLHRGACRIASCGRSQCRPCWLSL